MSIDDCGRCNRHWCINNLKFFSDSGIYLAQLGTGYGIRFLRRYALPCLPCTILRLTSLNAYRPGSLLRLRRYPLRTIGLIPERTGILLCLIGIPHSLLQPHLLQA